MTKNDCLEKLLHAYNSGSLFVHTAMKYEVSPSNPVLIYQTITSAFMFPIGGKAKIQLDDKIFDAIAGKMIYIPYASDLRLSVLSQEPYAYINIFHHNPERLRFEMDIRPIFHDVMKMLVELVTLCQSAKTKGYFHHNIQVEKLFNLLNNNQSSIHSSNHAVVNHLIDYIDAHYDQEITLEKLAKLVNMKEAQVSYLFKKYTNKRPIEHLIQLRIRKSTELIQTTDLPISEIAGKVGYQDPFYFSRLFKKYTGLSPTTLRLQSRRKKTGIDS